MYQFLNRSEAGKRLVPMLKKYRNVPSVVLAVPSGGIPVAYEVSKELNLPLEIMPQLQELQDKISTCSNPEDISGKIAILIDDGIATVNTILAAIKVLKKHYPAKLVMAVPVISKDALEKIVPEVDELITILISENFYEVGSFYTDFSRLSDNDVINYLKKSNELRRAC